MRNVLSKNDFTLPFLSNGATDEKQFFHLKLLYCEFQKYDAMTMSEVGGQPKKTFKSHLQYKATNHIERTNLLLLLVIILLKHAFRSCCRTLQDLRNCARDAKMRAACRCEMEVQIFGIVTIVFVSVTKAIAMFVLVKGISMILIMFRDMWMNLM